eukprot:123716_1
MENERGRTKLKLIVWNFIRQHYENKYNVIVPCCLKYLTMHFADKIIGCDMLTLKEDTEFFNLLTSKLGAKINKNKFNLLYRASENNYSASSFHKLCDDSSPTLVIIKNNFGYIFGGYTTAKWAGIWYASEDAFLFVIRTGDIAESCPKLIESVNNKNTVWRYENDGPSFGAGRAIHIVDQCDIKHSTSYNFFDPVDIAAQAFQYKGNELCGSNNLSNGRFRFKVLDYEVFAMQ